MKYDYIKTGTVWRVYRENSAGARFKVRDCIREDIAADYVEHANSRVRHNWVDESGQWVEESGQMEDVPTLTSHVKVPVPKTTEYKRNSHSGKSGLLLCMCDGCGQRISRRALICQECGHFYYFTATKAAVIVGLLSTVIVSLIMTIGVTVLGLGTILGLGAIL